MWNKEILNGNWLNKIIIGIDGIDGGKKKEMKIRKLRKKGF